MSKTLTALLAAAAVTGVATAANAAILGSPAFSVSATYTTSGSNTVMTVVLTSATGGGTDGSNNVTDVGNVEFDNNSSPAYTAGAAGSDLWNLTSLWNKTKVAKTGNSLSSGPNGVGNGAGSLDYFLFSSAEGAYSANDGATLASLANGALDSHFNFVYGAPKLTTTATGVDANSFTAIGVGMSVASDRTTLIESGGYTIAGSQRSHVYQLAQLVYPTTATGAVQYDIFDFYGNELAGSLAAQGTAVPEPASLGVLALGAVGLLSRRKKAV